MKLYHGIAAAGLVMLAACSSTHAAPIDAYRLGPGPNEITLLVSDMAPAKPAYATVLDDDESAVRIKVEVENSDTGSEDRPIIGVGLQLEVRVTLEAPLGERSVLNEDGSVVARQE